MGGRDCFSGRGGGSDDEAWLGLVVFGVEGGREGENVRGGDTTV